MSEEGRGSAWKEPGPRSLLRGEQFRGEPHQEHLVHLVLIDA